MFGYGEHCTVNKARKAQSFSQETDCLWGVALRATKAEYDKGFGEVLGYGA